MSLEFLYNNVFFLFQVSEFLSTIFLLNLGKFVNLSTMLYIYLYIFNNVTFVKSMEVARLKG